jgi:EasF-like predicted methyltransferase
VGLPLNAWILGDTAAKRSQTNISTISFAIACRSLNKTSILLSAFEKQQRQISYYALDISRGELADSLDKLAAMFDNAQYVKLQGLFGTYENCINWLAGHADVDMHKTATFLWMGNSIANLKRSEAGSLLAKFVRACETLNINCQFIVSVDGCQDECKILAAYDTTKDPLRNFVLNGLHHANAVMGNEIFHPRDWTCSHEFDADDHTLRIYYTALRDVECWINGKTIMVHAGRNIPAITSGKWTKSDILQLCASIGLRVVHAWQDSERFYSKRVSITVNL